VDCSAKEDGPSRDRATGSRAGGVPPEVRRALRALVVNEAMLESEMRSG
jgi:hypothetical protein